MDINLKGKNALIAGSTSGIGLAIAQELAVQGANCILLARNENKLLEAIGHLAVAQGQQHSYLVADFANRAAVQRAATAAVAKQNIHILINNSGGPPAGPIVDATVDAFESALSQHLFCNQILSQAVLQGMRDDGYGRIVNVISTSVKIPLKGLGVSNTTRGAVAAWAKTWSNEVAKYGITVNNILPGATKTGRLESIIASKSVKSNKVAEDVAAEMLSEIPMQRFGLPEELAYLAAFLASPAAAYITGVSIQVDGGRTGTLS